MPTMTAVGESGDDRDPRVAEERRILGEMAAQLAAGRDAFAGHTLLERGNVGNIMNVSPGFSVLFPGLGERVLPSRPMPVRLPPQAR